MALHRAETARDRRKLRIRKKVHGTAERPRLTVFRSLNHIYAQIINDDQGYTLAAASTLSPELKEREGGTGNIDAAKAVGALLASKAIAASVNKVVFDRNGFLYHGRIKALADAAREGGLEF
jgi:large subunit ribosomal protein L18